MKSNQKVCLIGQVIIDLLSNIEPIPRLGGIMHAARALYAMDCQYVLAYIAPTYLEDDIAGHALHYGATAVESVGTISGCPNVLLVGEPREIGDQRYEMILNERSQCTINIDRLRSILSDEQITDVIVFPGGYDLTAVFRLLKASNARVYIDANFEPTNPKNLSRLGRKFETIILSTSSKLFLKKLKGSSVVACSAVHQYAKGFLLKENRGGSRFFARCNAKKAINTVSQQRKIIHSVGVGDCFNAIFIVLRQQYPDDVALAYASMIAAEYACELDTSRFKAKAIAAMKIPSADIACIHGISLPWEVRSEIHIYIAAPDFRSLDRSHIDAVVDGLKYHNFLPRCPVRENGEVADNASTRLKRQTAKADITLLEGCDMLVSVLTFNDPGTLIEIGFALALQIPVIVYDPFGKASNLILTQLPDFVSSDLDEVITEVFKIASDINSYGKRSKHPTHIRRT